MKHVMLDLETAGRAPHGAIIAVGAALFDAEGVHDTFEATLDFELAVRCGGEIEAATIKWWLEQDADVRNRMFGGEEQPHAAFRRFVEWYRQTKAERIWANGTTFDMVILESALKRVGLKPPYAYNEVRDMRWLRDIIPLALVTPLYEARKGAPHDAVSDAITQAEVVRAAAKYLGVAL